MVTTGARTGGADPALPSPAERRIVVIGVSGSGKSTLSRHLGGLTGLPVIHLDRHCWKPGWVKRRGAEWEGIVTELVARPAWIMDGHFGGTLAGRAAAADLVIFLDLPTRTCLARLLLRWWRYRGTHRPDMTEGCPEHFSLEMLHWVASFRWARRPRVLRILEELPPGVRVVRLRTARAVDDWLARCEPGRHG